MPALSSITFTSNDASKISPTFTTNGIILLNTPASTDNIIRQTVTSMDIHYDINIPVNIHGICLNRRFYDISASPSNTIMSIIGRIFKGTGTNQGVVVGLPNPQPATDYEMADSTPNSFLIFTFGANLKHSATGF